MVEAGAAKVTIRDAVEADIPALRAMIDEFRWFLDTIEPGGSAGTTVPSEDELRRLGFGPHPFHHNLIAEEREGEERDGGGRRALGYLTYNFGYWADTATGTLFMSDLYVVNGERSRGIGRQLMEAARDRLLARGGGTMLWTAWTKNTASRRFYARLGAEEMPGEMVTVWRVG